MKTTGRRRLLRLALWLVLACVLCVTWAFALRWRTVSRYGGRVYSDARALPALEGPRVAIVFGAGVWRGSKPSPVLYDRVATAASLYHAGKARKLLMSGDNRFKNYNEPGVMKETAMRLGVPEEAIVLDFAGRRTYDSCYRAREIFGVRNAVLVTQDFHLERALYLCDALGIDSVGVRADQREYPRGRYLWWSLREVPATVAAWGDLNILRPTPVLGEKLPIQMAAGAGD
jgi:SanA protein